MKITTASQKQSYVDATIEGGITGGVISTGLLIPATMILRQQSNYFRQLPLPLKALGAVSVIVPSIIISAEKSGEAYSRSQWSGVGQQELEALKRREQDRWEQLGWWGQVGDWAKRRKWALIGASWVGAMAGSYALVARNSKQSFARNIVQARVYAQGSTVLILIGAALLQGTGVAQSDTVELRGGDHSWRDILEAEGYLPKEGDDARQTQLADARRVVKPVPGA